MSWRRIITFFELAGSTILQFEFDVSSVLFISLGYWTTLERTVKQSCSLSLHVSRKVRVRCPILYTILVIENEGSRSSNITLKGTFTIIAMQYKIALAKCWAKLLIIKTIQCSQHWPSQFQCNGTLSLKLQCCWQNSRVKYVYRKLINVYILLSNESATNEINVWKSTVTTHLSSYVTLKWNIGG